MEETIQGFLRSIIGYDDFLSGLSSKAQLLYFYLVIHADTDGFVYNGQVLSTMVMRSRTQKYLNELVKGNFVTTEEHVDTRYIKSSDGMFILQTGIIAHEGIYHYV